MFIGFGQILKLFFVYIRYLCFEGRLALAFTSCSALLPVCLYLLRFNYLVCLVSPSVFLSIVLSIAIPFVVCLFIRFTVFFYLLHVLFSCCLFDFKIYWTAWNYLAKWHILLCWNFWFSLLNYFPSKPFLFCFANSISSFELSYKCGTSVPWIFVLLGRIFESNKTTNMKSLKKSTMKNNY